MTCLRINLRTTSVNWTLGSRGHYMCMCVVCILGASAAHVCCKSLRSFYS